jgi:hypothetical protein
MTVSASVIKTPNYQGNGVTYKWPLSGLQYTDKTQLVGFITNTVTGAVTAVTSDFYVSTSTDEYWYPGYEPGSEPDPSLQPAKLTSTQYMTIARVSTIDQGLDLKTSGNFNADNIEAAFDKAILITQELKEELARTLKAPISATIDYTLPVPVANGVIGFNGAGTAMETKTGIPDLFSAAEVQAAIDHSEATGNPHATTAAQVGAYTDDEVDALLAGKEPALGNPAEDGQVLVSTADGTRSWTDFPSGAANSFRQGIVYAPANAVAAGAGLSVDVAADMILTAANGYDANGKPVDRIGITTSTNISGLTDNAVNCLYADIAEDGTLTYGKTTLADLYQDTFSNTDGQFVFSPSAYVGKVGNGAAAVQTYRVFFATATTSGGAVTAVALRAVQGRYDSGWFSITYGGTVTPTVTSKNHNLGLDLPPPRVNTFLRNPSYTEYMVNPFAINNNTQRYGFKVVLDVNTVKLAAFANGEYTTTYDSTNTYQWTEARFIVSRGW